MKKVVTEYVVLERAIDSIPNNLHTININYSSQFAVVFRVHQEYLEQQQQQLKNYVVEAELELAKGDTIAKLENLLAWLKEECSEQQERFQLQQEKMIKLKKKYAKCQQEYLSLKTTVAPVLVSNRLTKSAMTSHRPNATDLIESMGRSRNGNPNPKNSSSSLSSLSLPEVKPPS